MTDPRTAVRRAEALTEHAAAPQLAGLRARHPRVPIWYGGTTRHWWALSSGRLVEAADAAELDRALGEPLTWPTPQRWRPRMTEDGLKVWNSQVPGRCETVAHASDKITCAARPDDGGRLWFVTSRSEPPAPADRITHAAVRIKGYLSWPGDRPSHLAGP